MAISFQLILTLLIITVVEITFVFRHKFIDLFTFIFAILLLFPTDAIGILSGTPYSAASGKINISLIGYAVIIVLVLFSILNRGKLKIANTRRTILCIECLCILILIRIIVDNSEALSNKMLDNYLLPAIFAIIMISCLKKEELPILLKNIYFLIFIDAIFACIEFWIGKSLFFHDYYLSTTNWYSNVYYSTEWGVPFRSTSLLGHPLVGGMYYILALVYLLNINHKKKKILYIVQFAILILAIFSTNSRGVILCTIGYILYFFIQRKNYIKIGILLFLGLFLLSFIDFDSLYSVIFSRDVSGSSISVRFNALASISKIPINTILLGTGYNNMQNLLETLGLSGNFEIAYLIVFIENGLFGFTAWLCAVFSLYNRKMDKMFAGIRVRYMLNGMLLCFGFVAATSNSFGDPGTLNYMLWALIAFTSIASKTYTIKTTY